MKRINSNSVGVAQGSRLLFSDFVNDGPMWSGTGARETRVTIEFSEPFADVPTVHVSINMCDVDHKHNFRVDVQTDTITDATFDVVFRTWNDTRIARVRLDWMAIGPAASDEDWQLY